MIDIQREMTIIISKQNAGGIIVLLKKPPKYAKLK